MKIIVISVVELSETEKQSLTHFYGATEIEIITPEDATKRGIPLSQTVTHEYKYTKLPELSIITLAINNHLKENSQPWRKRGKSRKPNKRYF